MRATLCSNLAAAQLKRGDAAAAVSAASAALELHPGCVKALYRRGLALEQQGKCEAALVDLRRCLHLSAMASGAPLIFELSNISDLLIIHLDAWALPSGVYIFCKSGLPVAPGRENIFSPTDAASGSSWMF